jgi:hypothetical protein
MSEHQNNQKKAENNSSLSQLSQERATKSNAIEIPSISLPKGIHSIIAIGVFHVILKVSNSYSIDINRIWANNCISVAGIA